MTEQEKIEAQDTGFTADMEDEYMGLFYKFVAELRNQGMPWKEIRKEIDNLEDNENEDAGVRASIDDGTAWEGGFARNH